MAHIDNPYVEKRYRLTSEPGSAYSVNSFPVSAGAVARLTQVFAQDGVTLKAEEVPWTTP